MFEKEAEEYVPNIKWHAYSSKEIREEMMRCYRDGAEYGYNKKCEETFEIALTQIKHDRAVVIEENERLHAKIAALEKENAELKAQIEKMKCCSNCKHFNKENDIECCWNCERQLVNSLDDLSREEIIRDEWEIKENDN